MAEKLYAGIEAVGTKFVCIIASGPSDIRAKIQIKTTTPEETLAQVTAFFKKELARQDVARAGIGSFGPLELDPDSQAYGFITTTPKPGWAQVNLAGIIHRELGLPVRIDTDVNAAALGEWRWGAARGLNDFVYLTVGTGIGGGVFSGGKLVHGLIHPEIGHMLIRHDRTRDPYPGCCPAHADCWEGLACGLAIKKRWGLPAEELPEGHPAWELEAYYLAQGLMNLICTLSPRRIILGGGVIRASHLLPLVREQLTSLMGGYFQNPAITEGLDSYLIKPGLGDLAGVMGAIALAEGVTEPEE
ncbi:MAG TPA: ROK family protein [Dehalococcoidales bacterium]|nr:ROK family protein [Dehalococcoidales bacterium]